MYDLSKFTLRDMTELGTVLRQLGVGAATLEEVADRVVRYLIERLVDPATGRPACALVRFFKTHPYHLLDSSLREFARGMLHGRPPGSRMRCLTLLASAGERPEWNSRFASVGHKAIPLASEELVSKAPMISGLLRQLGVEVGALLDPNPDLLVERERSSFNVFYVPEAAGNPSIPAQRDFVAAAGIRSVLGFGGRLPQGDIFAVILFVKIPVPRETAELFRTLALCVKMAALPFDEAVFDPGELQAEPPRRKRTRPPRAEGPPAPAAELRRLEARVGTLEQVLEVYERSVLDQSDRLYAEQERMRFQTTLLESQGEASLDGILSVSLDGTLLFANQRLAEMWGVDAPRAGRPVAPLLRALALHTLAPEEFLRGSAELENSARSRDEVTLRDGRVFDRYTAPIRSQDGRLFGRVWHFRDISATKEIARMKNEFISALSHELRTPLTSIRGSLDLLVNGVTGELPAEALALAKVAHGNCARLGRLVNDVLDIEKMEAGRMELRLEPVEFEALVERSVDLVRPYAEALGVGLRIERSAPGARARADPDRLIQVVENLLSNAIKFSPLGGEVRICVARDAERLRVRVEDSGPGIPLEFQPRVFEKFAQGPRADARRKGGTGLGLHIARSIIERLGGTIGFTSKPGEGSSFHFELPALERDVESQER